MLAPASSLILASLLLGQVAAKPVPGLPTIEVNSEVVVLESAVARDLAALNELVKQVFHASDSDAARTARYEAMVKAGKIFELKEPTRSVVHAVVRNNVLGHAGAAEPTPVYEGLFLDGPNAQRKAFFFATQLDKSRASHHPDVPTADDLDEEAKADKAAQEREHQIYREAKTMKNAAKAKAATADLSTRKRTLQHALTAVSDALTKKYKITEAELQDIMERGEARDGTAARSVHKNAAAIAEAKRRNEMQLQAVDGMIGQGISNTFKENARIDAAEAAAARRAARESSSLPRHHSYGPLYPGEFRGLNVPRPSMTTTTRH